MKQQQKIQQNGENSKVIDIAHLLAPGEQTILAKDFKTSKSVVSATVRGARTKRLDIYEEALLRAERYQSILSANKEKAQKLVS